MSVVHIDEHETKSGPKDYAVFAVVSCREGRGSSWTSYHFQ